MFSGIEAFLQRRYSMFPNGWPGRGLLLIRLVAGFILIHNGLTGLLGHPDLEIILWQSITVGAGLLLLAGLGTPLAGILIAALELRVGTQGGVPLESVYLMTALALALMMIGPGVWSVDARLFGWKKINIPER